MKWYVGVGIVATVGVLACVCWGGLVGGAREMLVGLLFGAATPWVGLLMARLTLRPAPESPTVEQPQRTLIAERTTTTVTERLYVTGDQPLVRGAQPVMVRSERQLEVR